MESKEARKLIEKALPVFADMLALRDFDIDVKFKKLDHGYLGQCYIDVRYAKVCINLDLAEHETEVDLLETLRHELIHIHLGEFETYRRSIEEIVTSSEARIALDKSYERAIEGAVNCVERMLDRNGFTSEAIIKTRRKK